MMRRALAISVTTAIAFAGCAGKPVRTQIIPDKDGMNHAFARGEDEDEAEDAAYRAARDYCKNLRRETEEVRREVRRLEEKGRRVFEGFVYFRCEVP